MMNPAPIFRQSVASPTLLFYLLQHEGEIIHLTCDRGRHRQACRLVRRRWPLHSLPPRRISREELLGMLRGTPDFSRYQNSFFMARATPFQRLVWRQLCAIDFGHTVTYGELARLLGGKGLARAVGQACKANPIALLIPCHRVVGAVGIGGFAGGREVKQRLLHLEGGDQSMSSIV